MRRRRGGEAAGGLADVPEAGDAFPLDAGRSPCELGVRGSPGIASLSFPHSSSSPEKDNKTVINSTRYRSAKSNAKTKRRTRISFAISVVNSVAMLATFAIAVTRHVSRAISGRQSDPGSASRGIH